MTTLYVDRKAASLDAEGGTLVLRDADGTRLGTAPLAVLERVVVRGAASVSTRLVAALAEADCGLLLLSGRRGEPLATLLGRPGSDALVRLGQAALLRAPPLRLAIARRILRAKLAGQVRLLRWALAARPDRRHALLTALRGLAELPARLAGETRLDALMGIEGAAAAAFLPGYAALFAPALGFRTRNRRPPRDPVNAALSLAYTLATFEAARLAAAAGFDPAIGFLHAVAPGRPALACDLVEPWRPHADRFVYGLFHEGTLRGESFSADGEACLLGKAGRAAFYAAWEAQAAPARRALARALRRLRAWALAAGEDVTEASDGLADTLP